MRCRQIIMLRVHLVVGDFVLLDRTEGSQTDMEGHSGDVDPLGFDFFQQLVGKVQSCRRSCRRAQLVRIHRLITLVVLQLLGDVRRQRHIANLLQHRIDALPFIGKTNQAVAALHRFQHLAVQQSIAEGKFDPGFAFFPGLTSVSHTSFSFCSSSSTSMCAPVSSLTPYSLAGMTLESLTTSRSPGCSRSTMS